MLGGSFPADCLSAGAYLKEIIRTRQQLPSLPKSLGPGPAAPGSHDSLGTRAALSTALRVRQHGRNSEPTVHRTARATTTMHNSLLFGRPESGATERARFCGTAGARTCARLAPGRRRREAD